MARGLITPMLVILSGVVGGTLSHGLVAIILCLVVLSVFSRRRTGAPRGSAAAAPIADRSQP